MHKHTHDSPSPPSSPAASVLLLLDSDSAVSFWLLCWLSDVVELAVRCSSEVEFDWLLLLLLLCSNLEFDFSMDCSSFSLQDESTLAPFALNMQTFNARPLSSCIATAASIAEHLSLAGGTGTSTWQGLLPCGEQGPTVLHSADESCSMCSSVQQRNFRLDPSTWKPHTYSPDLHCLSASSNVTPSCSENSDASRALAEAALVPLLAALACELSTALQLMRTLTALASAKLLALEAALEPDEPPLFDEFEAADDAAEEEADDEDDFMMIPVIACPAGQV